MLQDDDEKGQKDKQKKRTRESNTTLWKIEKYAGGVAIIEKKWAPALPQSTVRAVWIKGKNMK